MPDDLFIVKRIREGDIQTFESLFKQYHSPLFLYALGITGSKAAAEEIIQDLFYVIWKEREKLHITHSLKSYLYKAVHNRALQHCEHHEVKERHKEHVLSKQTEAPVDTPQEHLEYKELEKTIHRALNTLPERRRKIFVMHRFEGLKYKEIAEKLSLSVKTVEAEMTKAYRSLRKLSVASKESESTAAK